MTSSKRCAVLIGMLVGLMPAIDWAAGAPEFTPEEKAWIAEHPLVRTRAEPNWRPFVRSSTSRPQRRRRSCWPENPGWENPR